MADFAVMVNGQRGELGEIKRRSSNSFAPSAKVARLIIQQRVAENGRLAA